MSHQRTINDQDRKTRLQAAWPHRNPLSQGTRAMLRLSLGFISLSCDLLLFVLGADTLPTPLKCAARHTHPNNRNTKNRQGKLKTKSAHIYIHMRDLYKNGPRQCLCQGEASKSWHGMIWKYGSRKEEREGWGKWRLGFGPPCGLNRQAVSQKKPRALLCDVGYGFSGPWDYKKMAKFAKA